MGFNRASGMTADNDEGDNEVTVIQTGNNGNSYSQSSLRARGSQGVIYTIANFGETGNDLEIAVVQIDQNSPFWTATVTIGWAGYTAGSPPPTTNPPSKNPTNNPTTVQPTNNPTIRPTISAKVSSAGSFFAAD